MYFLLDTNILLNYLKAGRIIQHLIGKYDLFSPTNVMAISAVTIGEMESFVLQRNWGERRVNEFINSLSDFLILPINSEDILKSYGKIDAYSQGKLISKPLPSGMSARNMGKNDLWIAATACVTGAKLLTTDKDFQHLDGTFIDLEYIDISAYY